MSWVKVETTASRISETLAKAAGDDSGALGRYAEKFSKAASEIGGIVDIKASMTLRGIDIPALSDKGDSKLVKSIVRLCGFDTGNYRRKVYLVYLVPLSAIICFILSLLGIRNRIWVLPLVLISGTAAIGGFYKILTFNLKELPVDITIGSGIWTMLYSFLAMLVVSIVWFFLKAKAEGAKP